MLAGKLPKDLAGPRGEVTIYTLSDAIGYRPQSVAEWFRKDQISIPCIELLMQIDGNTLRLSDFKPYCEALRQVLKLADSEPDEEAK